MIISLYDKKYFVLYIIIMSSKNTYQLINPHIEGNLDTVIRSRSPLNAGKNFTILFLNILRIELMIFI